MLRRRRPAAAPRAFRHPARAELACPAEVIAEHASAPKVSPAVADVYTKNTPTIPLAFPSVILVREGAISCLQSVAGRRKKQPQVPRRSAGCVRGPPSGQAPSPGKLIFGKPPAGLSALPGLSAKRKTSDDATSEGSQSTTAPAATPLARQLRPFH